MRVSLLSVFLAVTSLAFTGCGSGGDAMPSRMRERFEPAQPQVQVFDAERPEVFEATLSAMRQLDFTVSRSRMAQGIIHAHSRLHSAGAFGKARQYTFEVRLYSYEPGKTEVSVILREQEESASFAGATDLVLREHGLYGSFFDAVERTLKERGAAEVAAPRS
jgi:hypothetical protein